ncbi:hypothetical protein ACFFQW_47580 [Umezawaea endophytica]|uniref:Uncharacterized protein n=1 Tax=Umezawaea endophytica TaxID=1654476 RepID=A0A9X3AKR4_9PSEU|nr:hypothetical protein [Umezawaea endophytica]MCS7483285.1 hypothetical protein [Umezawaea endophytica]
MAGVPGADSPLDVLVNAVERVGVMRDPDGRQVFLDVLDTYLPSPLRVKDHSERRAHVYSIVLACYRMSVLPVLVSALESLDPGSDAVREARVQVERMQAADLLTERERRSLLEVLAEVGCEHVAEVCELVAGPAAAPPDSELLDPVDGALYLQHLNGRPGGVPPLLLFIEHLARHTPRRPADWLRRWSDQRAREWHVADQLRAARGRGFVGDTASGNGVVTACLVVRIERRGLRHDVYRLTMWRHLGPGWRPRHGGHVSGNLVELEAVVARLVDDAEETWAKRANVIRVEFLLPYDLLNLPVDQWKLETDSGLPQALGLRYQVVLRSLDRARTYRWHRGWKERWSTMIGALRFQPTAHWCGDPRARDLGELDALLAVSPELVSLVLSAPPPPVGTKGPSEILVGLRNGLPVMIWHRADGPRRTFSSAVRPLLTSHPDLPEQVRRLRGGQGAVRFTGQICSHVSLLWDDPNRTVEVVELPMAPNGQEVSSP